MHVPGKRPIFLRKRQGLAGGRPIWREIRGSGARLSGRGHRVTSARSAMTWIDGGMRTRLKKSIRSLIHSSRSAIIGGRQGAGIGRIDVTTACPESRSSSER